MGVAALIVANAVSVTAVADCVAEVTAFQVSSDPTATAQTKVYCFPGVLTFIPVEQSVIALSTPVNFDA